MLATCVLAVGILGPTSAAAQDTDEPDIVSFFATIASGLSDSDVFSIDARSFADQLRDPLSAALTADVVEALLGSAFRYGPIDRWVFCDGEHPCQMAYPGTHMSLLRATPSDDGDEIVLRLGRTGGDDGGVWRAFESMRVKQVEGRWRLVDAS
jgi:hypothetical protein